MRLAELSDDPSETSRDETTNNVHGYGGILLALSDECPAFIAMLTSIRQEDKFFAGADS